jgi:hypothetical protein
MLNHGNEPARLSWSERWELKSFRQRLGLSDQVCLVRGENQGGCCPTV